jgi:hypothetical protein
MQEMSVNWTAIEKYVHAGGPNPKAFYRLNSDAESAERDTDLRDARQQHQQHGCDQRNPNSWSCHH